MLIRAAKPPFFMQTQKLSLFDSVLLVSGSMIGSGIFLVTSEMTRDLGSPVYVMIAWLLGGVITLLAALNFGELAAMMPTAGGQYNFISRIYGKTMGFVYGWSVFTVIQSGVIAAVAMAFAKHVAVFYPGLAENHGIEILAIGSIITLSYINSRGVSESKWVQRIFTLAKLLALGLLIVGGIFVLMNFFPSLTSNFNVSISELFEAKKQVICLTPSWLENKEILGVESYVVPDSVINLHKSQTGSEQFEWMKIGGYTLFLAFTGAMVGSLFSSDAWQGITFMSNEVENPSKTIPRALFLGTLTVTIVYILANLAYFVILPIDAIANADADRVGVAAADKLLQGWVGSSESGIMALLLMAGLVVVSTFGCNNGLILAGSRLYKAMADHGLFFKQASELNKNNVPAKALWMQAAWSSVLCLSGSYGDLLKYCTFASLLFYIITVLGVIILRVREPKEHRPYKAWAYPISTIVYLLLASTVAVGILISQFKIAASGIAIVALGWPIYFLFQRNTAKE